MRNEFDYLKVKNNFAEAVKGISGSYQGKLDKLRTELRDANRIINDLYKKVDAIQNETNEVMRAYKELKDVDWWSCGYEKGYEVGYKQAKEEIK